jgi:hypothetical protein
MYPWKLGYSINSLNLDIYPLKAQLTCYLLREWIIFIKSTLKKYMTKLSSHLIFFSFIFVYFHEQMIFFLWLIYHKFKIKSLSPSIRPSLFFFFFRACLFIMLIRYDNQVLFIYYQNIFSLGKLTYVFLNMFL